MENAGKDSEAYDRLTIEVSSTRGCSLNVRFFPPSISFTTEAILRMTVCQLCGNKFHRLQDGMKCGLCQLRLPGLSSPELQAINVSTQELRSLRLLRRLTELLLTSIIHLFVE
jgi:hypothetical protein